jgi:HPt (histidine-containing phosphotransfer) domain-containing protein
MRGGNAAQSLLPEAPAEAIRGPIDGDYLRRQTLGDAALEAEVLRLFDQMARVYYGRLETSTDLEALLMHLHTLKGAAAGIGAIGLTELARVAEAELLAGAPVNPERIDDIGMALQEVCGFIADRLAAANAA